MAAAPARSMVTSPWPSSRLISAWIRWSPSSCSGVATRPRAPLSRSGIPPGPDLLGHPPEGLGEAGRVGLEGADPLLHQGDEVVAHPGDGGELAAVGDLVEGQPQPELAGLEPVELLEGHHVRADEVHQVLVLDGVLGEQQVVLAEHPGGQPAEHQAHLGAGGHPARRGQGHGQPLGDPVGARTAGPGSSRSRWGPTRRWKLATLACTQPARSVTRARAGPTTTAARWTRPPAPRPGPSAPRSPAGGGRAGRGRGPDCGHPPSRPPVRRCPTPRRPPAGPRGHVDRAGDGRGVGHGDQCR